MAEGGEGLNLAVTTTADEAVGQVENAFSRLESVLHNAERLNNTEIGAGVVEGIESWPEAAQQAMARMKEIISRGFEGTDFAGNLKAELSGLLDLMTRGARGLSEITGGGNGQASSEVRATVQDLAKGVEYAHQIVDALARLDKETPGLGLTGAEAGPLRRNVNVAGAAISETAGQLGLPEQDLRVIQDLTARQTTAQRSIVDQVTRQQQLEAQITASTQERADDARTAVAVAKAETERKQAEADKQKAESNGHRGGGGHGGGGDGGGGGKEPPFGPQPAGSAPRPPRELEESEYSLAQAVEDNKTRARGVQRVGKTNAFILPEHGGVYEPDERETKDAEGKVVSRTPILSEITDPNALQKLLGPLDPRNLTEFGRGVVDAHRGAADTNVQGQRAGGEEAKAAAEDAKRAQKDQADAQKQGTLERKAAEEDQNRAQRQGDTERRAAEEDQTRAQKQGTLERKAAEEDLNRAQRQGTLERKASEEDLTRAQKQGDMERRAGEEDLTRAQKQGDMERRAAEEDQTRAQKQGTLERKASEEDLNRAQRQGDMERKAAEEDQTRAQRQGALERKAAEEDQTRAQRQGTLERKASEEDLLRTQKQAAAELGQKFAQGDAGYVQFGRSPYGQVPSGDFAKIGTEGATTDLTPAEEKRARLAQAAASDQEAKDAQSLGNMERQAAEMMEKEFESRRRMQTSEDVYTEALRRAPALQNIEVANPSDGLRDLGNGYKQLGEVLLKEAGEHMRVIEGAKEEYQARRALLRTLESEGRGHKDQGIWDSFVGGAFGHGFESNQPRPSLGDAAKNLAGTAGVLARYGGEGRLLFGATGAVGDSVKQFEEYQKALIDLREAQRATQSGQVDLNQSFQVGAQYGLNEVESIQAGTAGLKAFSDELKNGTSAQDIFTRSVQAAGVAAVLTGKSVAEIQPQQQAISNEFGLGTSGLSRVNDAAASAGRHFNVPLDRIYSGMQAAGDLADVGGFDPERLGATVAAVDEYTGKDSGGQIARELAQGGSARFRTAVGNLGVQYNAEDQAGTLQKAGEAYAKLNDAQKAAFATSLGGARTAETVIALFQQQAKIAETTADAYKDQGKAVQEAHDKQATFAGELNQLHALLTDLATDLGKLGFITAFGDVLGVLSPIIQGFDDLTKVLDVIPGQAKAAVVALLAMRGLAGVGGGVGLLGATAGTTGRGAQFASAAANARTGAGNVYGRVSGRTGRQNRQAGTDQQSKATKEHTDTVVRDATATKEHTDAVLGDAAAARGEAEAKALETKTTRDNAAAQAEGAKAAQANAVAQSEGAMAARAGAAGRFLNGGGRAPGVNLLGEEAAAGGLMGRLKNFLPGSMGGWLGAGMLASWGVGAVQDTYHKTTNILDTKDKAADATTSASYSGSADALRQAASDANTAAQNAAMASGGLWGTILNAVTGGNSGQINSARATAARQNDLATQIDSIDQAGADSGQVASLDISSPDSLQNSLKALQATGASTTDVVAALSNAMDTLAKSGTGAVGRLNPTDVKELGARGGSAALGALASETQEGKDAATHGISWTDLIPGVGLADRVGEAAGGYRDAHGQVKAQYLPTDIGRTDGTADQRRKSIAHDLKNLKKVDQKALQDTANQAVQDYLNNNPSYDPKNDEPALIDYIDQMIATVPGLSDKDVDANTRHGIAKDIADSVTGAAGAKVDPANSTSATAQATFTATTQSSTAKSQTVGSLAAVGEYVNGAQPGDTSAVAAARSKLADDQKALDDAKAWRGKDGKGLSASQIWDDEKVVADDQVALNQSLEAKINDQIKINQSHRALSDVLGRSADNLDGLKQAIALATNEHDKAVAQAAYDDAAKQDAQLNTQTQAAGISIGINDAKTGASTGNAASYDPRDTLGNAQRQESGDELIFNQLDVAEKGLPQHSQQWIDAFKKVQEDKHQVALIELSDANAAVDAAAIPGDAMDAARDAITKATNTLNAQRPGTPEWKAAKAALNQANYGGLQAGADWQNALNNASITPGNSVQAAGAAAGNAKNSLDAATKYEKDGKTLTTDYLNKLAAYRKALYDSGQAIVNASSAEVTAKVFPGDAVGAAEAQITNLTAQMKVENDPAKWWQEWGQLQQAKVALAHAEIDAASVANTLASDTTNPVAMARIAADKARQTYASDAANKNLTGAARTRVLNQDVLSERQTQNAAERSAFDQWLSDTQINMELGRTSFAAYMQLLEQRDQMLKTERAAMQVGSDGYRQMTDQINQTEQTMHSALSQLSGQFNIGQDVKLPTVYEVRRSLGTAAGGTGYNDNRTVSIVINGVGSTQEVVQIVKQQLGTQATVTRGPTTARKV